MLEADLRSHYQGVSIGQYWRGEMSRRELLVLIDQLPRDSRLARAMMQEPAAVTLQQELTALLIDEFRAFASGYVSLKTQQPNQNPEPIVLGQPAELSQHTMEKLFPETHGPRKYIFASPLEIASFLGMVNQGK